MTPISIQQPPIQIRLPAGLRALSHRDFKLYWIGLVISSTGTWMQGMAHGWLVYELTHKEVYLGIAGAAGTLPTLLFTLPAGAIADRCSKRRVVLITQTLAMLQAFALAALVYTDVVQIWHVLVLALFSGCINSVDIPARHSMVIELTGREDLLNGIALNSTAFNAARMIGPAVAGVIVAKSGAAQCFLINGLSYIAAVVTVLLIRPSNAKNELYSSSLIKQISEGVRYAGGVPVIRDTLILTAVASVFALQYTTLMPAFAARILNVGPAGLGTLMSAAGAGALMGAASVALLGHRFKQGNLIAWGALVYPLGIIAFALSTSYHLSLMFLVIAGIGGMLFLAVSNSVIQSSAPDELRGRIVSMRFLAFTGLAPVGALQMGALAQYLGPRQAAWIGAAVTLAVALWLARPSGALRRT
jgi:MFS family permease